MQVEIETLGCAIRIGRECSTFLTHYIERNRYTRAVFVSDPAIYNLHGKRLTSQIANSSSILLPPGEEGKSLRCVEHVWRELDQLGVDRHSVVISLGGGAICDVAGFAASCYLRGLPLVHLPTTLVGMVDAAIGGKTAVNFQELKNRIGSFYQPQLVLIDPNFLHTLPNALFWSGMAEVIKYAVIADADLFALLEVNINKLPENRDLIDEIIAHCATIKARIVAEDEKDTTGQRVVLNFGHTFGHAIERLTQFATPHGEAVAIGMCLAARLACSLDEANLELVTRLEDLLRRAHLPTEIPPLIETSELIDTMQRDKKAIGGRLTFVLPEGIGRVRVMQLEEEEVGEALKRW